ncbi:MAG: putative lipid II flippase FtsW [Clostridiales bacterium]|nr:putative lipid II flippase FtsW [Clostridiales bacterium]
MRLKVRILITTLFLSLFGLVMIYSASSYSAKVNMGDEFYYVKKQALAFAAGLAAMFAATKIKTEFLKKIRWIIYSVAMVLLLILFIPGVGSTSYGATRWLDLKVITFQPSEIAKFALVMLLAGEFSERPPISFKYAIIPALSGIAMCVAVMMEPNMSITMCIGLTMLTMLFLGGMRGRYFIFASSVAAAGVPALIFAEPYRIRRLLAFINPWDSPLEEGYQLIQSYYALGSGGLFGVGLFASRQKYLFLPFAESDFIFSVIGEELGLFGSVLVLGVFFVLIVSGIMVAMRAEDRYNSLLAAGITTVIAVQTLINIAVVSGSIPPTGLPLPYISAGGSSLIVFMFASGLLINIAGRQAKFGPPSTQTRK